MILMDGIAFIPAVVPKTSAMPGGPINFLVAASAVGAVVDGAVNVSAIGVTALQKCAT